MELIKVDGKQNTVLFGQPGCGKTIFLASGEKDERIGPMYWIYFRDNSTSLYKSGIDYFQAQTLEDVEQHLDFLTNENDFYKSVVIDPISNLHLYLLLRNMGNFKEGVTLETIRGQAERQHYNMAHNQLREIMTRFMNLPINVFFVTHEQIGDKSKKLEPNFVGNFAGEVTEFVNNSWNFGRILDYVDDKPRYTGDRLLILQNEPAVDVKTQTAFGHVAPDEIQNPTLPIVWDALGL